MTKETAEQVQWRNIQKVVKQIADFCFESPNHPQYGSSYLAVVHSLTAKDGIRPTLEPLPVVEQPEKDEQIRTLRDLLERAQNGLRWYADEHPQDVSEADGEMHLEIDSVLSNGYSEEQGQEAIDVDHANMDAAHWAKSFCSKFPGHDESLMLSWFANAIMCGWDNAHWKMQESSTIKPRKALEDVIADLCENNPKFAARLLVEKERLQAEFAPKPDIGAAIAAMVIQKAAEKVREYFKYRSNIHPSQVEELVQALLSVTPANAEEELEALMKNSERYEFLRSNNLSQGALYTLAQLTGEKFDRELDAIVRRVLDEKGE